MQRPRGTKDIYGIEQILKQQIEDEVRKISELFNYQKIDTPIFEDANLFKRTMELSDIVIKELYEFKDKNQRILALRPENTAPVVRAIIENDLFNKTYFAKLYYTGQMFRYENPQKGRQRQFHQFGIENFLPKNPYVDAEVIIMADMILKRLKIKAKLLINSLGSAKTLVNFSQALLNYFNNHRDELSPISQKRLKESRPLRILDDKNELNNPLIKNLKNNSAFKWKNYRTIEEEKYFQTVLKILRQNTIDFEIDETLVRGLDYYNDTVFEFVPLSKKSCSQSTLIAGGRYDKLFDELNAKETNISGIGFALGIERLINELKTETKNHFPLKDNLVYIIHLADQDKTKHKLNNNEFEIQDTILKLATILRNNNFAVEWNTKPLKLQKALQKKDQYHPFATIVIGQKELISQEMQVTIEFSKMKSPAINISNNFEQLVAYLKIKLLEVKNEKN